MKKITLFLLSVFMFSFMYADDAQLTTGDLNCLKVQKHHGEKNICLPSSKPDNCSEASYNKLKSNVQECSFKLRGSLRSAL